MLEAIYQNIIDGYVLAVRDGVYNAIQAGYKPQQILEQAMIAAMAEVGRRFEHQTCFVPETLIAAKAMKEGMAALRPYMREEGISPIGKIVLGTVEGDIHDIGKNMAAIMFEGAGFEVIDLGIEVEPWQFVGAVQTYEANFVGMSSLLTTTMPHMARTIAALGEANLRDRVQVIVGGAPITQQFANKIGADLYAADAASGAARARAMALKHQGTIRKPANNRPGSP